MLYTSRRHLLRGGGALTALKLLTPASAGYVLGKAGGGGAGYVAKAVHFDGNAYRTSDTSVASDSSLFTFSLWCKGNTPVTTSQSYLFDIDPLTEETGLQIHTDGEIYFELYLDSSHRTNVSSVTGVWPNDTAWHHLFGYMDLNHPAGQKIMGLFLDGVDIISSSSDTSPAYQMNFGSILIAQPDNTDDYPGLFFVGDFSDIYLAPTVLETDITVFRNPLTGKPNDPSGFPSAPILFSGDAASFNINHGTGGAFTLTGILTNATTSPSD